MKYILIALLLFTEPSHAESLSDIDKDLKEVEQNLKKSEGEAGELSGTLEKTQAEVERLKTDTQSLAKKVKHAETDVLKLRERLAELEAEEATLQEEMAKLKKIITPMVKAGLDMARSPTDLTLFYAEQNNVNDKLIANVGLKGAARSAQAYMESYGRTKERLDTVMTQVQHEKDVLDGKLDTLSDNRSELAARMKEKEKTADVTQSELNKKKETIEELNKKRESLLALMTQLKKEQEQKRAATAARKRAPKTEPAKKLERSLARGLPASGYIVQRFGEPDPESGLASRGVHIEGESGGLVTAPQSGEVRFTGPFRGMGNLVIIESGDDNFSLLGGLGKISVQEGQKLGKGEPVGTLSASTRPKPHLYYELRRGSTPVDPLKLF